MILEKERKGIEKKFFELAQLVVPTTGLQLYDLEYIAGSSLLRLYIMNPATKTAVIDECVAVDRAMTPHIESESWMPSELNLEVSSPGVYRNLKSRGHFEMAVGEQVLLTLTQPLELMGAKNKLVKRQKVLGVVRAVEDANVMLEVLPEQVEQVIAFNNIKKANLEPDLDA